MINLPPEFTDRMRAELGDEADGFFASYGLSPVRGVRANTLKITKEKLKELLPFETDGDIPWEQSGIYVKGDGLGKTVCHAAGLYYVQEPSAMSVVPELAVQAGERVLDLCSAPGGKGTQLAQYLQGDGIIVMNEPDRKRYAALCGNVERMGVKNAVTTCALPSELEDVFPGYFEKILVDAPCSGEGMFRKDESAIAEWSSANVKACAVRQSKILESADKMLAKGGRIVYSTCTFSRDEDELQIEKFLKEHVGYTLLKTAKLYPHVVRGEGHFFAVMEKKTGERRDIAELACRVVAKDFALYREWADRTLKFAIENIHCDGGLLFSLPNGTPRALFSSGSHGIKANAGVLLGGVSKDGKRFEPAHSLAMSLSGEQADSVELTEELALSYLRGLTFPCEVKDGWRLVTYNGYSLGWCKVVGGTAKNHLPKGLRI